MIVIFTNRPSNQLHRVSLNATKQIYVKKDGFYSALLTIKEENTNENSLCKSAKSGAMICIYVNKTIQD